MKRRVITNFTDFGNREWKDRLHGGKADDKRPEDFDSDDIAIGTAIEMEHTNNPDIATEIALDHEKENDFYYDELIMSGIADEKDALDIFDETKTKEDKKIAIDRIQKHLDKEREKLNMDFDDEDFDRDFDDEDFNMEKDEDSNKIKNESKHIKRFKELNESKYIRIIKK
jgi:hypothetical protein